MKRIELIIAIATFSIYLFSCDSKHPSDGVFADIITDKGTMIIDLHYKETPITVANFVALSEGKSHQVVDSLKGKRFYDGLTFHRVVPNFMIQGGDILGNGKGSPGYTFEDEFPKDSLGNLLFRHDGKGIVSMANSGPNTNGSQFFITHQETPWLDGKHTVFGKVIDGLEIVDSIQQGDQILSVKIIKKGSDAKKFNPEKAIEEARKLLEENKKIAAEKRVKDSIRFSQKINEVEAKLFPSGLKVLYLNSGNGRNLKDGDRIKVHYTGYFSDGSIFDSSKKRNRPFEFTLGVDRVIEGWTEGMKYMKVGSKARLFIPYELGYGERGYGPIPAKSKLIFEVEIIDIVK